MYIDLNPAIIIILVVFCALTWQGWNAYKRNTKIKKSASAITLMNASANEW